MVDTAHTSQKMPGQSPGGQGGCRMALKAGRTQLGYAAGLDEEAQSSRSKGVASRGAERAAGG